MYTQLRMDTLLIKPQGLPDGSTEAISRLAREPSPGARRKAAGCLAVGKGSKRSPEDPGPRGYGGLGWSPREEPGLGRGQVKPHPSRECSLAPMLGLVPQPAAGVFVESGREHPEQYHACTPRKPLAACTRCESLASAFD